MDFHLRKATMKDAEAICRLSGELGYKTTIEKTQTRLEEVSRNDDHLVVVVCDENEVVGWIHAFYSISIESDSFVEIGGLVIDNLFRRKGLGKMLIENIVDWSRQRNTNKVRVRTNIKRKETHQFYESIGFSLIKEQKIFDLNVD